MKDNTIQFKIYKNILITSIILAFISIAGNIFSGFPLWINIKWLVMISSSSYFLMDILKKNRFETKQAFYFFLFHINIFLPYSFIETGGSANNYLGYLFLMLICLSYIVGKKRSLILLGTMILTFTILHNIEYFYPHMVISHDPSLYYTDKLIQTPLLLLASYSVIMTFAKDYKLVNKQLYNYAHFDELTGLYNRRFFNDAIKDFINKDFSLVIIDLDKFKCINDNHGHLKGDEALVHLSKLLKDTFSSESDMLSRWGGDEFAIITKVESKTLQKALETLEKNYYDYISIFERSAGLSYGTASLKDAESITEAFKKADKFLYTSKKVRLS